MTEKQNPLISIIIPFYNVTGYLETCLNSCILQTYKNIEIIAINDGSQDNTNEIINFYAKSDSRIIPINKNNEGVAKTRKTGIEKATGEYIFFLDGDDYIPIDTIEILIDNALVNNADIVIGNILKEEQKGFQKVKQFDDEDNNKLDFIKNIIIEKLYALWGKLYNRNLFDDTLCYHFDLKRGEDDVLLIQLINKATNVICIDKIVYFYRHRGGAVTKETSNKYYLDNYKATFIIEEYAVQYGLTLKEYPELGLKMCNAISYMIKSRKSKKLDVYCENKIKETIQKYIIEGGLSSNSYSKSRNKNYKRLMFYFRYPFISEKLFSLIYKVLK